jgi:uncharacterized protein YbcI
VTAAVTGLWAAAFGKGPEFARTYVNDDNVVVVMHGGLLPHEQVLLDAGEEEVVRAARHRFERALAPQMRRVVEEATRRRVATYDSQILFGPTRTFELFVLEPDEAAGPGGRGTGAG